MSLCLAIVSGKGGTGKSTVSTGLAYAFSALGKSVVLIDMDEGLRCLDLMLGLDNEIVFDLSDILSGRDISDALYTLPGHTISLIPAPRKPTGIQSEILSDLVEKLSCNYDVILLDSPAGIDFSVYSSLEEKLQFLTVCNPDPVSVRDAAAVCESLPQTFAEPRLILNRFDIAFIKSGVYSNIDGIIDHSGFRLIGIVPQNEELALLPINHKIKRRGRPAGALTRIARRLLGEQVKLPRPQKI